MDSPHRQGDKLRRQGRQLVGKVRAELTARAVEVGTGAHEVLAASVSPATGTWCRCWLTSRDSELTELQRDSCGQQEHA